MNRKLDRLWNQLKRQNIVEGEMPEIESFESPWYVRLLTIVLAWFAAIFLLGFVMLVFSLALRNNGTLPLAGLMIGGATYLLWQKNRNDFTHQLSLGLSFSGQLLFVFGLYQINEAGFSGYNLVWIYVALLQTVLALIVNSNVHRVFSSFAAAVALSIVAGNYGYNLVYFPLLLSIMACLWLNEFNWPEYNEIIRPISYGITLAVIFQQTTMIFYSNPNLFIFSGKSGHGAEYAWVMELIYGLVLVGLSWNLLRRYDVRLSSMNSIVALFAATLFSLLSIEARGLSVGLIVILLGYANGNRILTGLGILALLLYISSYYYLLNNTLLEKAQILLFTGILLLVSGGLVRWYLSAKKDPVNDA